MMLSRTRFSVSLSKSNKHLNHSLSPRRSHSNQPFPVSPESDPLLTKLEDAIHRIIARRSAPDWLPFVPGSSYWVPPPNSNSSGLASLLIQMTNPLTREEYLSTTTSKGWPSSDFFVKGAAPHPFPVDEISNDKPESEAPNPVELEVNNTSNNTSQSEDEEG